MSAACVPAGEAIAALTAFDEALPSTGADVVDTLDLLDRVGSAATVASGGAGYFGFVTGATLPAALGAAWMGAAWDQNAVRPVMSPVVAKLHDVTRGPGSSSCSGCRGHRRRVRHRGDGRERVGASRPLATHSSPAPDGTCSRMGCSARRRSTWWSANVPTRRCRSHSDSWVSVAGGSPWSLPTIKAGCEPTYCPRVHGPTLVCVEAGEV